MDLLQNFYETTLNALKETKNDRLWFKTKLKLGKLYFDNEESCQVKKLKNKLINNKKNSFLLKKKD